MFVGLRERLHQVHALGVDLDERQDVPFPDGLVHGLQPGLGVGAELQGEAFLRVLRRDVVFPHLPGKTRRRR